MRFLYVAIPVLALVLLPVAGADHCVGGDTVLCDYAHDARMDLLFGSYADVGLALTGLFLVALILSALVWLFSGGNKGPKFSVEPREQVKEVGPGGTAQLLLDVENRRKRAGLDLWIQVPDLPVGWSATPFAAVSTSSGFTFPIALSRESPLHLSGASKGANKAAVAVQITAPPEVAQEESLDLPVRLVPLAVGVPRPRKGRETHFAVQLTTRAPVIEVVSVRHDPERIAVGKPVTTQAHVTNAGDAEARDVAVSFLINDQTVDQKIVPNLPAGGEATVEFHWVPAAGANRIRIHVA
jgi:hypothetical protein